MRCLGNWGKLLEIGKYDILRNTPIPMRPMLNNISYEGIDVDRVMNHPDSTEVTPTTFTRGKAIHIKGSSCVQQLYCKLVGALYLAG